MLDDAQPVGEVFSEIAAIQVRDIASFHFLHRCQNTLEGIDATQFGCQCSYDCELENDNFYYCIVCNKKFCSDCKTIHSSIHKLIPLKKVNYTCFQHNIELNSYCLECCENLCKICKIKHERHKIFDFNSEILKNEEIRTIKNYIERGEEKIILTKKKLIMSFIH